MATEDDGSVEKMTEKRERMVQRRTPLQGALLRLRIEGDAMAMAMVDSKTKACDVLWRSSTRMARYGYHRGSELVRKLARSSSSSTHRPQTAHNNTATTMRPSALLWLATVVHIKPSNAFLPAWKIAGAASAGRMKHDVQSSPLMANGGTYASSIMMLYSQPEAASSSSAASAATSAPKGEDEKDLTPETIAEMIEVSFLQGCMQLAQGYVDVLKLFIVAVKTGYEKKIPLDELNQLVQDCPVNSAGRDLMKEELELRREWMAVVYGMMEALNNNEMGDLETTSDTPPTTASSSNDSSKTRVTQVVDSMLQLQRYLQEEEDQSGGEQDSIVALTNLTVEQALQKLPTLSQLMDELESSPMEKAFLTNDIRVALLTFKVIEEEKICFEDRKGSLGTRSEIPRPPIEGT